MQHGEFKLLDVDAAGLVYRTNRRVLGRLAIGDKLVLAREPTNPADPCAVKICTQRDEHIAYVPRVYSRMVCGLLDHGYPVGATVVVVDPDKPCVLVGLWLPNHAQFAQSME